MVYVGFFGGAIALALAFYSADPAIAGISLLVALGLFGIGGFTNGSK